MNPWFLVALIAGLLGLAKLTQDKSESNATDDEKKAALVVKKKAAAAKKKADDKAAADAESERIEQQQKDDDAALAETVQAEENAELLEAAHTIIDEKKIASDESASD